MPDRLSAVGLGEHDAVKAGPDHGQEVVLQEARVQAVDAHEYGLAAAGHRIDGFRRHGARS